MNPQQFAEKIRTKYPGAYDSLSDEDLTNKIVAKYPMYAKSVTDYKGPSAGQIAVKDVIQPFASRSNETMQDFSQTVSGIKEAYKKRVSNIGEIRQTNLEGQIGTARGLFQSTGQVAGALGDFIGEGVKGFVKGAVSQGTEDKIKSGLSTAITPVIESDIAQNIMSKYDSIKKSDPVLAKDIDALFGILDLSSNFVGVGAGAKGAKTAVKTGQQIIETGVKTADTAIEAVAKTTPKLLSYTSEVPESAFKVLSDRTDEVTKLIKQDIKPEQILENTRKAVKDLRKTLSNDWDESVQLIIKENTGVRYGLNDNFAKKLLNVADEFGIDLPQNLKNISALESINLLKKINELPKLMLTMSPKGAVLREVKDGLKQLAVKSFGGEKGAFNKMYNNYAIKKKVLDSANDIVRAYADGKPIQTATAQSRLMKIFDENKTAYLDAIVDLEKATGQDLLSGVTAGKFSKIAPTVSSLTGGFTQKALKLLVFPLTSPRAVAWIQKNIDKLPNRLSNYVKNPKAGLSIKANKK